ncbi:MAG: hypothetical protein GY913_31030 [Proteobacteria bacterium]|nr:hypothetical protein [Pseudomonadota bacterium]
MWWLGLAHAGEVVELAPGLVVEGSSWADDKADGDDIDRWFHGRGKLTWTASPNADVARLASNGGKEIEPGLPTEDWWIIESAAEHAACVQIETMHPGACTTAREFVRDSHGGLVTGRHDYDRGLDLFADLEEQYGRDALEAALVAVLDAEAPPATRSSTRCPSPPATTCSSGTRARSRTARPSAS